MKRRKKAIMDNEISEWDDNLSPEAKELLDKMMPEYLKRLEQISRIPVSVLIWGPSPDSQSIIGKIRKELRQLLREKGNLAMFSEEICDPNIGLSIRVQQLVQAEQYDLIISIPEAPGSIGEIHDFANDNRVNRKIIIFLNEEYLDGYSAKSLYSVSSVLSAEIVTYTYNNMDNILSHSLSVVNRIKEYKYVLGGKF